MQWSAANLRIMFTLIREEKLQQGNLFQYLAYTVKVSEMAQVYTWQSILLYDQAYRKAQARENFKWGSDTPHVDRLHLRFREPKINLKPGSKATKQNLMGKKSTAQDTCGYFQNNSCPYGDTCKYRHVCRAPGCGGNHPLIEHASALSKQGNAFKQE